MKTSLETPIPLLDLALVHGPLAEELARDFARVLRSGQFILGPEHDAFEKELVARVGRECNPPGDILIVSLRLNTAFRRPLRAVRGGEIYRRGSIQRAQ